MAGHFLHFALAVLIPFAIIGAFLLYDRRTMRKDAEAAAASDTGRDWRT